MSTAYDRESAAIMRLSLILPYTALAIYQHLDGYPDKVGYCDVAYRLVSDGDVPFTDALRACIERGDALPPVVTARAISEQCALPQFACLGWAEVATALGKDAAWAADMATADQYFSYGYRLIGEYQRMVMVKRSNSAAG